MRLVASTSIVALALTVSQGVNAVPAIKSFQGNSPYRPFYAHEPEREVPEVPNPREHNGAFTDHRRPDSPYWTGGWEEEHEYVVRAKSILSKASNALDNLAGRVGLKFASAATGLASEYVEMAHGDKYDPEGESYSSKVFDGSPDFEEYANPSLPKDSGFDYNNKKVRGVNLGNWLLFELWMDSKLSKALNNHAVNAPGPNPIVDEWTAGLYSTKDWLDHVLNVHFQTWITEDDFKQIAAAGLNHVRIPFPYFGYQDMVGPKAPYFASSRLQYLKQGVMWAKKYGIKVWIDLHAVPGSQSDGYDNSGHASGKANWAKDPDYLVRTKITMTRLINEFTKDVYKGTVTAIEPVNEPWGMQQWDIQNLLNSYYRWSHYAIGHPNNQSSPGTMMMATHDGFQGLQYWQNFWTGIGRNRVILDTHPYFVYSSWEKQAKDSARLKEVCQLTSSFTRSAKYYPSVAGEWAPNGPNGDNPNDRDLPRGPRTFPSGPNYPYSVKYMAFMSRNFATQQQVFEKGAGWIMWAWKNRNAPDWSYQTGLQYGWIPKDLNSNAKAYGDACADYSLRSISPEDPEWHEEGDVETL